MDTQLLNHYLEKYYVSLLNTCRIRLRYMGRPDDYQEIVHDVIAGLMTKPEGLIRRMLADEGSGNPHLLNFLRLEISRRIYDSINRCGKFTELNDQHTFTYEPAGYEEFDDERYARFREVSCNMRPDDFLSVSDCEVCIKPPRGRLHGLQQRNGRYVYWKYIAVLPQKKGGKPKIIKCSKSRHAAYMAIVVF